MSRVVAIGLHLVFAVMLLMFAGAVARADARSDALSAEARQVLVNLYGANPQAAVLGKRAHGVLVFPQIKKADLTARPFTSFAGGYGEGALVKQGATTGFYHFASGTWARTSSPAPFSLVVFLMTDDAERRLSAGAGFEASDAVMLAGRNSPDLNAGKNESTYVLAFDEQGPIEAVSLINAKVTPIVP